MITKIYPVDGEIDPKDIFFGGISDRILQKITEQAESKGLAQEIQIEWRILKIKEKPNKNRKGLITRVPVIMDIAQDLLQRRTCKKPVILGSIGEVLVILTFTSLGHPVLTHTNKHLPERLLVQKQAA